MIEEIRKENNLIALIIKNTYKENGIKFFTPNEFSQQLAYMNRPKGYVILPHIHNLVKREVYFTKEVLYIKSGKVRVDFYEDNKCYLKSFVVSTGDVILLASGGHGFTMLENSEIIEIKQGPFVGEHDKTRFEQVSINKIKF